MSDQQRENLGEVVQYHSRRLAELAGEIESLTARIARVEEQTLPREPDEDVGLP